MIPREKIDQLLSMRAAAPPTIAPCGTPSPEAAAFYEEAYSSLAGLLDETIATRKAALVVLAAIAVANDEADYEEFRATVVQLLDADKLVLERWLEIYQAGAK